MKKSTLIAVAFVSLIASTSSFAAARLVMNCADESKKISFGLYENDEGALVGALENDGSRIEMTCDRAVDQEPAGSTAPRSIGTCHYAHIDQNPMFSQSHNVSIRGAGCFSGPMATYSYNAGFCQPPRSVNLYCQYAY